MHGFDVIRSISASINAVELITVTTIDPGLRMAIYYFISMYNSNCNYLSHECDEHYTRNNVHYLSRFIYV